MVPAVHFSSSFQLMLTAAYFRWLCIYICCLSLGFNFLCFYLFRTGHEFGQTLLSRHTRRSPRLHLLKRLRWYLSEQPISEYLRFQS